MGVCGVGVCGVCLLCWGCLDGAGYVSCADGEGIVSWWLVWVSSGARCCAVGGVVVVERIVEKLGNVCKQGSVMIGSDRRIP